MKRGPAWAGGVTGPCAYTILEGSDFQDPAIVYVHRNRSRCCPGSPAWRQRPGIVPCVAPMGLPGIALTRPFPPPTAPSPPPLSPPSPQVCDFAPQLLPARVAIVRPSFIGALAGLPCPGYTGNLAGVCVCGGSFIIGGTSRWGRG